MEQMHDPAREPTPNDESIRQLRMLVHASAVSLLILAGTVFIFLYRQVVNVRKSTTELVRYIAEYENSQTSEFINQVHIKFNEFRKEHPDFNPVYIRYFGTNDPPPMMPRSPAATVEPGGKVVPAPQP